MEEFVEKLSLVIYIVTMVLGLPANVFVIYMFYMKTRRKWTPNLVYMINLCVSDLLFIMFLPVKIIATIEDQWTLPSLLCPIYNFFHFSAIYASVYFLTVVSVGRYVGAAFPITYKIYKKPKYSCFISVGLWLFVFGHCSSAFFLETKHGFNTTLFLSETDKGLMCFENLTQEQLSILVPVRLEMAIALFFLPMAVTTFCYIRCIRILMRSHMHVTKKRKAVRVAATTLVVFVVCFAPYNISHVVGFVKWESLPWRRLALLPSICNTFLDPLIFYFLSSAVDKGFEHVWNSLQLKYISTKHRLSSAFGANMPNSISQTAKTVSTPVRQ